MKTVVVTGPVCGGKSTLSRFLVKHGGVLVDADRLGHAVLELPEVRSALTAAFGEGILVAGHVDRARLGRLAFADPVSLATLNRITHPPLGALIDARLAELERRGPGGLAVLEAAVYFLLPIRHATDLVVTVTADRGIRLRRLRERSGLDGDAAAARIDAQRPLFDDWDRADLVIVNDGEPSVLKDAAATILERLGDGA